MRFTARSTKPKSGVVAPLQRLMYLWRAYEGPERFDCLSIGKVARRGQIRPQNALSLPQSPFDYEVVLHRSKTSAISVSSLRFTLPSAIHFGYGVAYRMSPGAMASSVDGISRPSVLAVLRLMTSSYLVGCPIGPSASRCCPYRGLQRRWTCPIGAVIGGRVQTVHSAQRGRAEGVRPPDGVDEP